MKSNEDILIKKDELGIIPLNAKELLAEDLKVILAKLEERFDLENDKTKEQLDMIIKNNPEIIEAIKEEAFYTYLRDLARECDDYRLRQFLTWNYHLEEEKIADHLKTIVTSVKDLVVSISKEEIQKLYAKWSKYFEILRKDYNRMSIGTPYSEEAVFFIDEDEIELEQTPEKSKLEERLDFLVDDLDTIASFLENPYGFYGEKNIFETEREICLKLIKYIMYNAFPVDKYGLLLRVQNDIMDSDAISLRTKEWFLDSSRDYFEGQKLVKEKPSK